eukprot:comp12260_c0_seq1/m.7069 comp12260_c0_seq1/g.7069  ORF comp12260_c0_seq1/g.7069 comp12260_c0_seq1/m.7069 type:complete len:316 (-) comp12260_c0_seq1:938-1885(-)
MVFLPGLYRPTHSYRAAKWAVGRQRVIPVLPTSLNSNKEQVRGHRGLFTGSNPVLFMQDCIVVVHETTHLPWWASIALTTVGLRGAVTLPLTVYQQKVVARLEALTPELGKWIETLKHHVALTSRRAGLSYEEMEKRLQVEANKKRRELYRTHKTYPYQAMLVPWVQLPIWVLFSLALRSMTGFPVWGMDAVDPLMGMTTGGALWFTDLTAPDPLMIFPVVTSASALVNLELTSLRRIGQPTLRQTVMLNLFRGLSVGMFFVAIPMPAGISMFWAVSGLYRLGEHVVMKLPRVRRFFNLPLIKATHDIPTPKKDT